MKFNYKNNLESAIGDYFKLAIYKHSLMDGQTLVLTDDITKLFLSAISIYEKCLIDAFENSNLPVKFLENEVTFSINEYPWIFTYVYGSSISIDVDIFPRGNIELCFNILIKRFNDGNVTYLSSIPDTHLRNVDFTKVPVSYMVEKQLSDNGKPYEGQKSFRITQNVRVDLLGELFQYHKFADILYPGMRDDYHLGVNYE